MNTMINKGSHEQSIKQMYVAIATLIKKLVSVVHNHTVVMLVSLST